MARGKPKAIIIYGQPGAGKGTQANLVARNFGFIHFDTGKYLESLIYDSRRKNNPVIKRERKFFESGELMTPSWVLEMVSERTEKIAKAGLGIVFSGSPRTVYEAKGLLPKLEKLYGRSNIVIFIIKVTSSVSIKRNSHRLVCAVCGSLMLFLKETEKFSVKSRCPFCGGKLFRRSLDKPEIIKKRMIEYNLRTKPIFAEFKRRGYKVNIIIGEALPSQVFRGLKRRIYNK